jgi:GR25 family glycosyltransferase involved in LPS biosynthesis
MLDVSRTFVLNLPTRQDRLHKFLGNFPYKDWPFGDPVRVIAVNGYKLCKPKSFTEGFGGWGCYRSYTRLFEDALRYDWGNFAVFEDDCVFSADFGTRLPTFLADVPSDWDMIFLGGIYRKGPTPKRPELVKPGIVRASYLLGTWAVIYNARAIPVLYQGIIDEPRPYVCDVTMARTAVEQGLKIYCPMPWLCGMDEGQSDLVPREYNKPLWLEFDEERWEKDIVIAHFLNQLQPSVRVSGADIGKTFTYGNIPNLPWEEIPAGEPDGSGS